MRKVNVILGPTSAGKTKLAVELCQELGGEIISADSRQIYKHMDIGTGKIPLGDPNFEKHDTKWTMEGVNIWGYDLVAPDEGFSSYDFAVFALQKLEELLAKGKNVFLVGGTGFYIDMVTGRIKPSNIAPDMELRKVLGDLSLEQLKEKLKSLDAVSYEEIDRNNPVRIIRAIEKNLSKKKSVPLKYLKNVEFKLLGLSSERKFLYDKADHWAEEIWQKGLLEEVSNLMVEFKDSDKLNGLVYKETKEYLEKRTSDVEALQRIKYSLHAYIRRQQTYYKKIPGVTWIDVAEDNHKQKVYNTLNG